MSWIWWRTGRVLRRHVEGRGPHSQQTFIDTYSKLGFAKRYDRKSALTAADLLNDQVVPFFAAHEIPLSRILTDRGTEYCGSPDSHEYQLYLAIENIDHTRTKVKSPQTNGIVERFHKTMLNEFYRITFRKKIYTSLAELQTDLEGWLREYNEERVHQGRWCYGRTPLQTFKEVGFTPTSLKCTVATDPRSPPPHLTYRFRFPLADHRLRRPLLTRHCPRPHTADHLPQPP
jgi:integrase-like protein